jgi:hypothetical protein
MAANGLRDDCISYVVETGHPLDLLILRHLEHTLEWILESDLGKTLWGS